MGVCKKDGLACDGDSVICRLNPSDVDPHFFNEFSGEKRKFFNRECSNFKKVS